MAAPEPLPLLCLPALHASHAGTWLRPPAGETQGLSRGAAVGALSDTPHLILNAPLIAARLGYPDLGGLDLLELFAFVHPARFCVPTARGLAEALALACPDSEADIPLLLQQAGGALLAACEAPGWPEREGAWGVLRALAAQRWPWASVLAGHIARPPRPERTLFARLPEWEEAPPRPQPRQIAPDEEAIIERLNTLTGAGAEQRPGQRAYARAAAAIFAPREAHGRPHMLLAQAGTGIGKTLGYLAPGSLWAEQAGGTLWVSTYTKNLQRQLRRESARVWPAPGADGRARVVVRKGRENYLCLLNLEDALQGGFQGRAAVAAQLVGRWAACSVDGDLIGGDLPGWLGTLFRARALRSLTDQRGECIYAACPHYRKCFIERSQRAPAQADLVIANHALVILNAARGREAAPARIIFDEGHHVFDAADATFSLALSGQEAIELRRWILGPERSAKGRRRGLGARLADLAGHDETSRTAIEAAARAAAALPAEGWLARLADNAPQGQIEALLVAVRALAYARDETGRDAGYGIETEASGLGGAFVEQAQAAEQALAEIRLPLIRLGLRIAAMLEDPPDWLAGPHSLDGPGALRARLEGARHALAYRVEMLGAWQSMLAQLGGCGGDDPADRQFVTWLAVARHDAREIDVGLHRHFLDPMQPFARTVLAGAHGVMLTSATLCDRAGIGSEGEVDRRAGEDWQGAIARSGAPWIEARPQVFSAASPFDYAARARVLIVTDLPRGDLSALAGALTRIIEASGGGVLGLFTAIRRLRAVHGRIADRLARAGLALYAQHVDPIDTGTLVDIFRDDPASSLLGTDALRDGVDVPGRSLRCVVMEQVPWPRPTILHRARRAALGGPEHDDRIVRARLAQAFGRLIRSGEDRGHFVLLSPAFPSRLLGAFPPGVKAARVGLEEALQCIRAGVLSADEAQGPESRISRIAALAPGDGGGDGGQG